MKDRRESFVYRVAAALCGSVLDEISLITDEGDMAGCVG